MNPVLILTHNNLELTKRCVESVLKQDIPTEVLIYDNGSTDGTVEWLPEEWVRSDKRVTYSLLGSNRGVSAAWNLSLIHIYTFPHRCYKSSRTTFPKRKELHDHTSNTAHPSHSNRCRR